MGQVGGRVSWDRFCAGVVGGVGGVEGGAGQLGAAGALEVGEGVVEGRLGVDDLERDLDVGALGGEHGEQVGAADLVAGQGDIAGAQAGREGGAAEGLPASCRALGGGEGLGDLAADLQAGLGEVVGGGGGECGLGVAALAALS